ncbi:MAG: TRAP transporter large permease subunit [Proteobacteria bacterium]|nr:TRAP transporter large permease subunit [Pseudomonadota bacterium]
MTGIEIGLITVALIFVLIIVGMPVPIAFLAVSFVGVWLIRGDFNLAVSSVALSATDSIADYLFAVIPLFVLMGLLVMAADMGRDSYAVANQVFRKVPGGLGLSTVGGNAIFAAITGVSVASAAVFTKLAVPEMLRFGYSARFAVGVVAGSSVLGMLIPPSLLFILFGILTETSIRNLFLGGILPGLVLAAAFCVLIVSWALLRPRDFGHANGGPRPPEHLLGALALIAMIAPITLLVGIVLGGLYGGFITATEGGAVGATGALMIALMKRKLTWARFWRLLLDAGAVTTSLLLLIIGANLYSRVLAMTGLPMRFGDWFAHLDIGLYGVLAVFVGILLVLGFLMDSTSILFIIIPLVLPVFRNLNVDMVWLGVIAVLTIEIGLLTPPFGISVFVVKGCLNDKCISIGDIFAGAAPFAIVMLVVVFLIACFPWLATAFT